MNSPSFYVRLSSPIHPTGHPLSVSSMTLVHIFFLVNTGEHNFFLGDHTRAGKGCILNLWVVGRPLPRSPRFRGSSFGEILFWRQKAPKELSLAKTGARPHLWGVRPHSPPLGA